MSQRLRSEAADFEVVLEDGERLADVESLGTEELPLVIVTGPPGENAAHVEPLAFDLQEHICGCDSLSGTRVMRAAGRMDVVISAEEAELGGVDPALELDAN